MGYYTRYTLFMQPKGLMNIEEQIHSSDLTEMAIEGSLTFPDVQHSYGNKPTAVDFIDSMKYCLDEESKWYEYRDDMIALSKVNPDILFRLHGEGEENGDIWDYWFQNGKGQQARAEFHIAPFDPKKMS